MNCAEFEACLLDLAAERSREELLCTEALSHARVCSRCAARLAEETELVAGLNAWSDRVRYETAPPYVEEALLTRFRKLEREKTVAPPPLPDSRDSKPGWWRIPGYAALAASVLLMMGWALIQHLRETGVHQAQVQPAPKSKVSSEDKGAAAPLKAMPVPASEPVRKPAHPRKSRPPQVVPSVKEGKIQYAARRPAETRERGYEAESVGDDGIETEFLPFMTAGPRFPSEQRQFVRVKLPRSALQVFGLPMNMERALEPVQADVMLSEDGRALAVRFIRD